ncbi:unnamed protein product [Durusdinium trenchii]|uniref:Uncharacterized protein n=2 Tax=Durusdinium trenchii TaxID=1381693 RepID=A0ABP0M373_9DINO
MSSLGTLWNESKQPLLPKHMQHLKAHCRVGDDFRHSDDEGHSLESLTEFVSRLLPYWKVPNSDSANVTNVEQIDQNAKTDVEQKADGAMSDGLTAALEHEMDKFEQDISEDRIPLYRLENTSITWATGVGLGSYFALKRFRPSIAFPWDVVPPFVTFWLTHRFAQAAQMPQVWDSLLGLPSPLGDTARGILAAVRTDKRLPSEDFNRLRPSVSASGANLQVLSKDTETEAGTTFGAGVPGVAPHEEPNAWGGSWGGTSDKCVFADSNRCNGRGAKKESSRSTKLSHGILFDMENGEGQDPQDKAPKRTSWEEIRARAAQQDGRGA